MSYQELLYIRNDDVDGENNWCWIKTDTGAWDGPKQDWLTSHKEKYLKHLKKRDVVVTAGANQGLHTRFYAKLFRTIYAFEPDPLNFHCMVNNSQYDNVIKLQAALGKENGMISVRRSGMTNTGMHTVTDGGFIPIFALDTFKLTDLDLLQLDVEGFEFNVLEGARETIAKFKPVIALENGHRTEICNFMSHLNYSVKEQSVSDAIWVSNT